MPCPIQEQQQTQVDSSNTIYPQCTTGATSKSFAVTQNSVHILRPPFTTTLDRLTLSLVHNAVAGGK